MVRREEGKPNAIHLREREREINRERKRESNVRRRKIIRTLCADVHAMLAVSTND
jgi:hypothetical protein